jgi:2'-5' RNA ligase
MMIRAFIAIALPPSLQLEIEQVQQVLQPQTSSWRWVKPANVHLTLKFLGDISPEAVASITQAMAQVGEGQPVFPLLVRGLGCFPHLARPRVLWMGLEDPQRGLASLHERLESALASLGFPAEQRPFRPHLTLARARQGIDRHAFSPLLQAYSERQFGEITVERIHLFQSRLHREGAVYTILQSVTLRR